MSLELPPDLAALFKEKQALLDTPKVVKPTKKKQPKKEKVPVDIFEQELKYYEYDEVQGTKIYNGVLLDSREKIETNIEFYSKISPHNKHTPLVLATLTANGQFSNINFNEEELIETLEIPPIEYSAILKIVCNFGELYTFPNPYINHPILSMVRSIETLENIGVIKIGCNCQDSLLDTDKVLLMIKELTKYTELFNKLIIKYIKDKLTPNDNRLNKKRLKAGIKNISNLCDYFILEKKDIDDVYTIIDMFIPNKSDIDICKKYLDKIQEIIKIFTSYEEACKCVSLYIKENNIIVDKNACFKSQTKSARGRKPKGDEKKVKRKAKGTGKQFGSQVSFEVYNTETNKITKIKLFRNGVYGIPGIKKSDMTDSLEPLLVLKNYLNYVKLLQGTNNRLNANDIKKTEITYMISVMRNYKCKTVSDDISLILNKLEDILYAEKHMPIKEDHKKYIEFIDSLRSQGISQETIYTIFKYSGVGFYQISEISWNTEKYVGLMVKFLRTIPGKDINKLTIKILSSGKINIDGSTSEMEALEMYYWIQYILYKYWDEITFDFSKRAEEIISEDSASGYESIYDDEL
jgi:hypothetical protein